VRLLVSVRSPAEVEPAVAGGADIVDAKEPSRGSLGAVMPETLRRILERVPVARAFSVALGDAAGPDEVIAAISSLELPRRPSPTFLKLGFAGLPSREMIHRLIRTAVETAAMQPAQAGIVAVAYADSDRAGTVVPELILEAAHRAGATGVLLDTHTKDGKGLLRCLTPGALSQWVSRCRELGLLTALAGELKLVDMGAVSQARPDIVGVRGAACEGGRGGRLAAGRVEALCQRLAGISATGSRPVGLKGGADFAKRGRMGEFFRGEPS
jgi:uncharacterized protein (UPF0264 family)